MKTKRIVTASALSALAVFALLGSAPTTAGADSASGTTGGKLPPPSYAVAAASPDWMLTPAGLAHRSCVHQVPSGAAVSANGVVTLDGVVISTPTPCQYSGMVKTPDQAAVVSGILPGLPNPDLPDSWWLAAWWLSPKQVVSVTAKWTVPAAPKSNGATVFLFPSIMPNDNGTAILQPVLQWGPSAAGGGSYWTIASWFVPPNGAEAWTSPLLYTASGRVLTGTMKRSSGTSSKWTITLAQDPGVDTELIADTKITSWRSVQGGVLEMYTVSSCANLPNASSVKFSSIAVKDTSGTISPSFSNTRWVTSCSAKISHTTTSATLSWNASS